MRFDVVNSLKEMVDAFAHPALIVDSNGDWICTNVALDALSRIPHRPQESSESSPLVVEELRQFISQNAPPHGPAHGVRRGVLTLPGGRQHDVLVSSGNVRLPDGADGTFISLVDITVAIAAAHAAEASASSLQAIMDCLPIAIFHYVICEGEAPRITYITERAGDIFGLDLDECLDDMEHMFSTVLPRYSNVVRSLLCADGVLGLDQPVEFQVYDGRSSRIKWINCGLVANRRTDGCVVCSGFLEDVTARKEAELELSRAREVAESVGRIKSMFLANMSHEIRTPMNAVLGMMRLALKGTIPPTERSYIEAAQVAAKSLLGILDDVLDSSKIEAGKLSLKLGGFDLRQVVDRAVSISAFEARQKGIEISCRIDPAIKGKLVGDALRLGQILTNLVANAVKFTAKGTVSVEVDLVQKRGDACDVLFSINDTGIGMTSAQCAQLFQAFTQMDESRVHGRGGTGLGLLISRELVRLMGGDIHVSSAYRKGTTFSFLLNFKWYSEPEIEVARVEANSPVPDFHGHRVVVAEDNYFNQVVIREMLHEANVDVTIVDDGRSVVDELVERGERGRVSLVLMDLQLPVLDGIEATRLLRANPAFASLPIVAMTAHAMSEDRSRCLEAGMNDYIAKPIDPDELYRLLGKWLSLSNDLYK